MGLQIGSLEYDYTDRMDPIRYGMWFNIKNNYITDS